MTNIKDKLSASVRQAKAGQQTTVANAAEKPAATNPPVVKPAASKPAVAKPAARPANKDSVTTQTAPAVPGDVPQSGNALFPARVWPD